MKTENNQKEMKQEPVNMQEDPAKVDTGTRRRINYFPDPLQEEPLVSKR